MFGIENSFLSALGPKLDFLPLEVMQTCWPTVPAPPRYEHAHGFNGFLLLKASLSASVYDV